MYTRVYQGKGRPLPEEYHGTAFREEQVPPQKELLKEETLGEEIRIPYAEEATKEAFTPRHEEAEVTGESLENGHDWQADILLLALCALLVESEGPDNRLLALLLLLLLSPNT